MTASTPSISHEHKPAAEIAVSPAVVLVIAVIAGSMAAPFMRVALDNGLPALLVAAGRLGLSALFLTPLILRRYRGELRRLDRSDIAYALLGGILAGLHFICVATSLKYTSVLIASVIITTIPIWVALLEITFLKVRLNRMIWGGIIVTCLGSCLIALSGLLSGQGTGGTFTGSLLALMAAIFGAGYLVAGRKVRSKISIMLYVWMVFGTGSLVGFGAMLFTATPVTGYTPTGYFWLVVIALVPQLIAHSGINYAVGYMPASSVSLGTQMITPAAAVMAFFMFAEVPGAIHIFGSLIIVAGVLLAIRGQSQPGKSVPMVREPDQMSNSGASLSGGQTG